MMEYHKDIVELINTVHGEFPQPGIICTLVRFRLCNYACPFCDTKRARTIPSLFSTEEEFIDELNNQLHKTRNLLITGGEPGLYVNGIISILRKFDKKSGLVHTVQIETNGTIIPFMPHISYYCSSPLYVVWSPKFDTDAQRRLNQNIIDLIRNEGVSSVITTAQLFIKIIDNPEWDQQEVDEFISLAVEYLGHDRVALMPLTGDKTSDPKETIRKCLDKGIQFSPRIHLVYNVP